MKMPFSGVHIYWAHGMLQGSQLYVKLVCMFGLNASFGASFKKPFQSLVPKTPDHEKSVKRTLTLVDPETTPTNQLTAKYILSSIDGFR